MYQYTARIDRVIDGDTIVVDVDLGFYIWMKNLHLRLYGINAPEKSDPSGWRAATDFVSEFVSEFPTFVINVYGQDKYGRWLAEILDPRGGSLNKSLVDNGLAKVYNP